MVVSVVFLVKGPTCPFGTESQTDRTKTHVRQTISWMTSGRHIAHILSTMAATKHELQIRVRIKLEERVAMVISLRI